MRESIQPITVQDWIYVFTQLMVSAYLLYIGWGVLRRSFCKVSLAWMRGDDTRLWFSVFIMVGLTVRVLFIVLVSVFSGGISPFTVAIGHCLMSLIFLTGYSMVSVFFAEICGIKFLQNTTSVVGLNVVLYLVFFCITCLTKIKHAHRAFRMCAFFMLGLSHLFLGICWAVFGVVIVRKLNRKAKENPKEVLLKLESGYILEKKSGLTYPITEFTIELQSLLTPTNSEICKRSKLVAIICPPSFFSAALMELYFSVKLFNTQVNYLATPSELSADYFAVWNWTNAILFISQILPTTIILFSRPYRFPADYSAADDKKVDSHGTRSGSKYSASPLSSVHFEREFDYYSSASYFGI